MISLTTITRIMPRKGRWADGEGSCGPGGYAASSGGAGASRILGQDAELVAFGIGKRDPAAAIGPPVISKLGRPQRHDPFHLLLAGAVDWPQVEVDPVLHALTIK